MVPPKPRLLIHGLFGYYVRYHGGEIRLKALAALGTELGVPGPTIRVMAARMRSEALLAVRQDGRESIYGLTPKYLQLLDDGRRRIFRSDPPPWERRWSMVIYTVPESDRSTREQLRKDLTLLGFGPLAPATWVSPHSRLDDVANVGAALPNARLELVSMIAPDLATDRSIAARCWDLASLNNEYKSFIQTVRKNLPDYRRKLISGADALAARTSLLRTYRELHTHDPDLPVDLQPAGWLGDQARTLFLEANALLEGPAELHYRKIVDENGPL